MEEGFRWTIGSARWTIRAMLPASPRTRTARMRSCIWCAARRRSDSGARPSGEGAGRRAGELPREHATHILSGEYERYTFKLSRRRLDEPAGGSAAFRAVPLPTLEGAHVYPLNKRQEGLLHDLAREAGEHAQDTFSRAGSGMLPQALPHLAGAGAPRPGRRPSAADAGADQRRAARAGPPLCGAGADFGAGRALLREQYYLTHLFRAWTGCTPKRYLQLNRISCAKGAAAADGPHRLADCG